MRNEFELAEIIWETADSKLTADDRDALMYALHTGDPFLAIFGVIRMVVREDTPLPANVFREFQLWLDQQPPFRADDPLMAMRLELHVIASSVRHTDDITPVGGYGQHTLCHFIFDDAGVTGTNTDAQAGVLRQWLSQHRPSPALRADMRQKGFGHLLDDTG